MITPPALNAIISLKYYHQIVIDTFQEYADEQFEGKFL